MSDWIEKKPVYKRSKRQAPFCPDCGEELDDLDMINYTSSCKCGEWSDNLTRPTYFRSK